MAQDAREKILRFYKGTEGEEMSIKLVDLAYQALKNHKYKLSGFLTPFEQEIAGTISNSVGDLKVDFDGGYIGAERQRAAICHVDFEGTPAFEISVIKAAWNGEFARLSHSDVLGSIMSLGVDREHIGDIIATKESAKILVDKKMAEYFTANLTQIGGTSVKTVIDELSSIAAKEERCKEIRATVASLRIDSIAAAGFGMSRSKAAAEIDAEKVKLNWQTVKNASQSIKEGDILSMRGRGRLEVAEIRGLTKKGRTGVLLKRYF
ncbi:MAG: RNA-binding protein [Selenomonadaceae bacterium]|nr:RNA-binding protein [Selenomonadaceae bacterium]